MIDHAIRGTLSALRLVARHRPYNVLPDDIRRPPQRISIKMGIARRCLGLRVAEQFAYDGKAEA
jgi:hypothetical protein